MRTIATVVFALFALTALDAEAGKVQINKAKRKCEEKAQAGLAKVKKACGHAGLTTSIDWTGADNISDDALKEAGRTRENAYDVFGSLVEYLFDDLHKLCADADYKGEIKKLKTVKLITPKDLKQTKLKVTLKGGALHALMPLFYASSWSDGSGLRLLKGLF